MKKFSLILFLGFYISSSAFALSWDDVEKAWKKNYRIVVNGVEGIFESLADALAHLDSEIRKIRERTIILDENYWKTQIAKVQEINISEALVQLNKEFNNLKAAISVENLDKLDDGLEIGGTLGEIWEKGKEWTKDRLKESGSKGPKLDKARPRFRQFVGLVNDGSPAGLIAGRIVANNNELLVIGAMNQLLRSSGTESGQDRFCYNGLCIDGAIEAWNSEQTKAGIVCPGELFNKARAGETGIHLVRVSEQEWCRLANQHHSDRWANGFRRTVETNKCTIYWQTLFRLDDWFKEVPPTYRCVDLRDYMKQKRDELNAYSVEQFEIWLAEMEGVLDEIDPLLEDYLFETSQDTIDESNQSINTLVTQNRQIVESIASQVEKAQAEELDTTLQLSGLASQVEEFSYHTDLLKHYIENAPEDLSCDSSSVIKTIYLTKKSSILTANVQRIASLLKKLSNSDYIQSYFDSVKSMERYQSQFYYLSNNVKSRALPCFEVPLPSSQASNNFEAEVNHILSLMDEGMLYKAYLEIQSLDTIVNNGSVTGIVDSNILEGLRQIHSSLYNTISLKALYKELDDGYQAVKSNLNDHEKLALNYMLSRTRIFNPVQQRFVWSGKISTVDDIKNLEFAITTAKGIYDAFSY